MQKRQNTVLVDQSEVMVFVTHADTATAAEDYAESLREHDIPCSIEDCGNGVVSFGFGLFVPEQYYDEAHMIIESRQSQNSFYDFFFDDTSLGES